MPIRDRKRRKRTFRALWIQRLNAAVRPFGLNYSRFIAGLDKAGVTVDRKVLSDLAIHEPAAFQAIVEKAKAASAGLTVGAVSAGLSGILDAASEGDRVSPASARDHHVRHRTSLNRKSWAPSLQQRRGGA